MTTNEDPTRREADDLFDARGIADEHRDPELVALERSLAPLTADVPPLAKLPPRTTAPVLAGNQPENQPMTLPPAIPSSARPSSASRGIVFGAVALAAVSTLAVVWATRPPVEVREPAPVVSTTPADRHVTPESPQLTLVPPSAAVFELAELSVVPMDSHVAEVFRPRSEGDGSSTVVINSNGYAHMLSVAKSDARSHYLAKSTRTELDLRFSVELERGTYLACGVLSERGKTSVGGCAELDVADDGTFSPAFIRLEHVETPDPSAVSPDLKDPFASSREAQPGEQKQPGKRRKKKSAHSDDLKDPFRSRKSSGAVSPNLEDPFGGKSKSDEDDGWDKRGVLDPWSDDGDGKGDGAVERPKKRESPNLKDPYGR